VTAYANIMESFKLEPVGQSVACPTGTAVVFGTA
jgi:hypothetical protein